MTRQDTTTNTENTTQSKSQSQKDNGAQGLKEHIEFIQSQILFYSYSIMINNDERVIFQSIKQISKLKKLLETLTQ